MPSRDGNLGDECCNNVSGHRLGNGGQKLVDLSRQANCQQFDAAVVQIANIAPHFKSRRDVPRVKAKADPLDPTAVHDFSCDLVLCHVLGTFDQCLAVFRGRRMERVIRGRSESAAADWL